MTIYATNAGCPTYLDIVKRSVPEEEFLIIFQTRPGLEAECQYKCLVLAIVKWDAVPEDISDNIYGLMSGALVESTEQILRGCQKNKEKTCQCQGGQGASYTFDCTWLWYYQGCKWSRSRRENVRKYKKRS